MSAEDAPPDDGAETIVYDLRVIVDRIEGRSVCGLSPGDYFDERDTHVCCPDPDERVVMRIERIGERRLRTTDLT
jgi:rubredoxin